MHHQHLPLSELKVADSVFLAFICCSDDVDNYIHELKTQHPEAAHIPYAASFCGNDASDRVDDGGEPEAALVGGSLLRELKLYRRLLRRQRTMKISGSHNNAPGKTLIDILDEDDTNDCGGSGTPVANAVIIVRYFGNRLLGVTCGRLQSLYIRAAKLALHRQLYGLNTPFVEAYRFDRKDNWKNVFGLGAGDTELILDVIRNDGDDKNSSGYIVDKLMHELQWEVMVGSKNEMLPRLQNLQADLPKISENGNAQDSSDVIIPVYRYPGNYSGTEWNTWQWSHTTLKIKDCVEKALQPLYDQKMNHCVSNLYRDGADRIDHHSDKDLDLNRNGMIVSVSLGCTRVMELRDRKNPGDVARIELPEGSMLVLGPYSNSSFTHSILPQYEVDFLEQGMKKPKCRVEKGGRISLTLRDVRTFLDVRTQRLFGQGISGSLQPLTQHELHEAALAVRKEDSKDKKKAVAVAAAIGMGSCFASARASKAESSNSIGLIGSVAIATVSAGASYCYIRHLKKRSRQLKDEMKARDFFSKKSVSGTKY